MENVKILLYFCSILLLISKSFCLRFFNMPSVTLDLTYISALTKACCKFTFTSSCDIFIDFHTWRKHIFCSFLMQNKDSCQDTRSHFFRNNNTTSDEMERKHAGGKITFTEQIIRK
jgi:hypothetical protein